MRFFKFSTLLLLLLALTSSANASNSDSLDVLHYDISIDTLINGITVKKIKAHTNVQLVSTVNSLTTISLDLLHFTIDSIKVNGVVTPYSYDDTLLVISPASVPTLGDTVDVTVWYQGRSPLDAGGFGGLYFVTGNIFNLGVGLTTLPHTYGRSVFPCKDNFTDRAYFDFHVRTLNNQTAICNGKLQSAFNNGDGTTTWNWKLRDPIPTYLASFAVAGYAHVANSFVSTTGDTIPFDIYAAAADTTNAKTQSQNLMAGVAAFENRFGPFRWERLGYVIVNQPVTGSVGAMEHATNIAYPRVLLNQGQGYETIWAHEASHHWFGDLVTCDKVEEMWINEGWASYCEAIFEESVYGVQAYKDYIRSTHADVLRRAHHEDGGYQALSNMPEAYTYGRTTYSKGMTVVHSMRSQVGDNHFFTGVQNYLANHQYDDVNSDTLRLALEAASGQNLQNWFDAWVHEPGYSHISMDSFYHYPGGLDHYYMFFKQQLKGGATTYNDSLIVPIRILGANWERLDTNVVITGPTDSIHIGWMIVPVAIIIDPEEKLADATTDNYKTIKTTGTKAYAQTYADVLVDSVPDSAWIQVTHHWIAPDSFWAPQPGLKLSDSRYWTVDGILPASLRARLKFYYNGSTNISAGLLDNTWMTNAEDSLVLFYRPDARQDWTLVQNFTRNVGSPADKTGNIVAGELRRGDYALGEYDNFHTAIAPVANLAIKVYPNPNDGKFYLDLPSPNGKFTIRMVDGEGNLVQQLAVENQVTVALQQSYLAAGWYLVTVTDESGKSGFQRILIEK
jgi:hypothetical protein